jgi:hypothetical protein
MDPFVRGWVSLLLIIVASAVWITFYRRKIKVTNVLMASGISIVFTLLFSELFVGNTWYRNTYEGEMRVSGFGMMKVLFEPLNPGAVWLWSPEFWFQNVFVLFKIAFLSLTYLRK